MALVFDYGVAEFSSTPGTLPYVLEGALANSFRFRDRMSAGDTCWYWATNDAESEYGVGTFEFPDRLLRTRILGSSNSDMPVDWLDAGRRTIKMILPEGGYIPPGGDCRQALFKRSDEDQDVEWRGVPVPLPVFIEGMPAASQHPRIAIVDKLKFPVDFAGSVAWAEVAPTNTVVVPINRITPTGTVQIGTITFASAGGYDLREDGSFALREDGSKEERA